MKQSKYFLKPLRKPPSGEVSRNAQLLEQAGYISKLFAGVYSFLPLGWRVLKKIENIIREEINGIGGQELFMPALHPLENYKRTKRDGIDILFHLLSASGKELVLGQSHEEVIVPLAKQYINSYRDLPLYLYQIQTKFRNELRAKSGILRGREFLMKDLYSFHTDEKDFEAYYEKVKVAYRTIFSRVGLDGQTHLTFASGGSFSKYSHEFQTITEAGEDTIHLCQLCGTAVNDEIINEQKKCPQCGNSDLIEKKSIEVGNIFPLKSKFSDSFNLTFTDEDGIQKPVLMGCYGIGLGRTMGAIAELHSDSSGLCWPKTVSPFNVHLLDLTKTVNVPSYADTVYMALQQEGIEVLCDDRKESAGVKMKDSDLIGIPVRLIVSERTGKNIEITYREDKKQATLPLSALINEVKQFYCETIR
ncbi:MAG: aminoacyl--tRNA ligase-related protein [Patescibacteria group bacterium]